MTNSLELELKAQAHTEVITGVGVRLYHESMSGSASGQYHKDTNYRVWMDGEYDVLTKREANTLIKKFNSKLCET